MGWSGTCAVARDWHTVIESVKRPRFRIAIQVDDDPLDVLTRACEILLSENDKGEPAVSGVLLVCEEAGLHFDSPSVASSVPHPVRHFIRLGRKENLGAHSWMLLSQRYVDVPILFRSQATDLHVFATNEEADLKQHRRHLSVSYVDTLRRMPKYYHCHIDLAGGTLPELVDPHGRVVQTFTPEPDQEPVIRERPNNGLPLEVGHRGGDGQTDPLGQPDPRDRGVTDHGRNGETSRSDPDLPDDRE